MKTVIKTFKINEKVAKQLEVNGLKQGLGFSAYLRTIIYSYLNNIYEKKVKQ